MRIGFQVIDKKHGFFYHPSDLNTLAEALSLAIKDNKLSNLAQIVSSYEKSFSKDLLAADCILGYANLLENVLQFPSDALLPRPLKQIQQRTWLWTLFESIEKTTSLVHAENSVDPMGRLSIVYSLEEQLSGRSHKENNSQDVTETSDGFTQIDWDDIHEMEISQDFERRELEEVTMHLYFFMIQPSSLKLSVIETFGLLFPFLKFFIFILSFWIYSLGKGMKKS